MKEVGCFRQDFFTGWEKYKQHYLVSKTYKLSHFLRLDCMSKVGKKIKNITPLALILANNNFNYYASQLHHIHIKMLFGLRTRKLGFLQRGLMHTNSLWQKNIIKSNVSRVNTLATKTAHATLSEINRININQITKVTRTEYIVIYH
jgi:hypothetical protein